MDVEVAKDKGSCPKITVTVSDLEPAFWMKFSGLLPAVSVFFWIVAEDNCQLQRRLLQSRAIERGIAHLLSRCIGPTPNEPATQNSRNTLEWRNVWDSPPKVLSQFGRQYSLKSE